MNHQTKYWELLADGRVQCNVCPRECKLNEGQRGLCFVRACRDKEITLTTYGRSSGFCIDPIEKKPLNHFLPGTPVLSFGTAGCNLTCKFCQNYDISKSREMDKLADQASPEKVAGLAEELGCNSIAFTYNDPTIFLEYAVDVAKASFEFINSSDEIGASLTAISSSMAKSIAVCLVIPSKTPLSGVIKLFSLRENILNPGPSRTFFSSSTKTAV